MEALLALFFLGLSLTWLALPVVAALWARAARRETAALRGEVARLAAALAARGGPEPVAEATAAAAAEPATAEPPAAASVVSVAEEPPAAALPLAPPTLPPPPAAEPPVPAAEVPAAEVPAAPAGPEEGAPRIGSAVGGLEEKLGARLPVWIGGVALALSGIFLVQYSIERGWLSPTVRVALGALFGVALLAGGEGVRRRAERISQALSAAGIAVLYAAFLAASNLYHLIPPAAGFGLMALVTAVAVVLSLRQGPLVAVLGLLGGFLTPALLRTPSPSIGGLVAYLLPLQVGLLVVARRRRWPALAALAVAGGVLWVLAAAAGELGGRDGLWLGLLLLGAGAAAVWLSRSGPEGAGRPGGWLAGGALGSGLAAFALVTGSAGFAPLEWGMFGLLAAGCLLLARLDERLEGLAWLAAGTVALLLAAWAGGLEAAAAPRFVVTAGLFGLLLAGGAYAAQWGAPRPGRWAWLAAAAAVGLFLVAHLGARRHLPDVAWGAAALALAALALAAAWPLARRRAALAEGEARLAALAAAVTTFVSLAVPLELDREWLTVAWALEVPALLALALRLRVPALWRLAAVLAAAVAARLLLNPFVLDYPTGETPIVNWLLYGYGVPALACAAGARLARRAGVGWLSEALGWGAAALAAALVALELRHLFGGGSLTGPSGAPLFEAGALAIGWAGLGLALLVAGERWPTRPLRWGGAALLSLGLAISLVGPGLALNPAWEPQEVGPTPVANALLWLFGLPLLLALSGRARLRGREGAAVALRRAWAGAALALVFLLVTLEVRQLFRGSLLAGGRASGAENLAYSAAWILLGLALLGAGARWARRAVRQAGLGVLLLAVLKVFLYDLSELAGLHRVLSFLGLGLALLALAYLYQRLLGRERAP